MKGSLTGLETGLWVDVEDEQDRDPRDDGDTNGDWHLHKDAPVKVGLTVRQSFDSFHGVLPRRREPMASLA